MSPLKLSTLLLGAVLFTGMGATSLSAEGAKCGAKKDLKTSAKCGSKKDLRSSPKCGSDKKIKSTAKCGGEKKAPKKSVKCGSAKCG